MIFGGLVINTDLKRLYDVTDNLIKQQFYLSGSDTIIGRTPEISIKIKNSGLIVKRFKDLFNNNIQLFLDGNYMSFFQPFKIIKGINDNYIREIYQDIQIKLTAMHGTNFDVVILYTIVLSSLITSIRDIHFNKSVQEVMRRLGKKSNKLSQKQIQIKLDKLYMHNNKNISILYNISYLDALAESFHFMKTARTCKIQKSKYINSIVNLILFSKN